MRGKPLDEELKAAVLAALLAGMTAAEASRKYSLPYTTVQRMRDALGDELVKVGDSTRGGVGDILVSHLHTQLSGLDRIAKQTECDAWIEKQNAAFLAELYGKIADHSIRLLEAASAAEGATGSGDGGT